MGYTSWQIFGGKVCSSVPLRGVPHMEVMIDVVEKVFSSVPLRGVPAKMFKKQLQSHQPTRRFLQI